MLQRRHFIGGAAAGIAAPALLRGAQIRATPPNIVFIMADDLGYADVGCYGREDVATPNIDRLADGGMLFTDAYSASSVCSPTRLALITGRYPGREAAGLDEPISIHPKLGISSPTFVEGLRAVGYQTSLVGKWHLGGEPRYSPLKHGYEHFFGFRAGASDYFTHKSPDGKADLWDGDRAVETHGYLTDLIGRRAVLEIARMVGDKRPFLLSLHFNAPHWPWETEKDEARAAKLKNLHDFSGGGIATYRAMIESMDRQIGSVLDALLASSRDERTIVIFTSDNGGERFAKTWPFAGRKGELLEGGIRVPLLVQWPDRIAARSISHQASISMDWAPTFFEAAGLKPWRSFEGTSLLSALGGSSPFDRTLFWRHKAYGQQAVRRGHMKYLQINGRTFLFDLANDPQERANLKDEQPALFAELQKLWRDWNDQMLAYPRDAQSDTSKSWSADRY